MVKTHPLVTELIAEIEAYCARANITQTDFGKYVLNNGNFVTRLKHGSSPTLRTIARVQRYIDRRTKAVVKEERMSR